MQKPDRRCFQKLAICGALLALTANALPVFAQEKSDYWHRCYEVIEKDKFLPDTQPAPTQDQIEKFGKFASLVTIMEFAYGRKIFDYLVECRHDESASYYKNFTVDNFVMIYDKGFFEIFKGLTLLHQFAHLSDTAEKNNRVVNADGIRMQTTAQNAMAELSHNGDWREYDVRLAQAIQIVSQRSRTPPQDRK